MLVSALITSDTPPDPIYRAWRKQAFDLISCEEQLIEIERVLARLEGEKKGRRYWIAD